MRMIFDDAGQSHPPAPSVHLPTPSRRQTTHQAGHYLHLRGDTKSGVYRIQSGIVALEEVNEEGHRCILQFLGPGALLGGEVLWQPRREFDARACTHVSVERCFTHEALQEQATRLTVAETMAQQGQRAARLKAALHQTDSHQRVLNLLSALQVLDKTHGLAIWLPSRYEMADYLDLNHATVSRVIARLRRDGVIQLTGAQSAVVAWDRLQATRSQG